MIEFISRKVITPIKDKCCEIKYRNCIGDTTHDLGMRHIWGIKSYDDLSGAECNLYTMNDLDILYYDETDDYGLSIETVYEFKEQAERRYLNRLLEQFTEWMISQGYSTENKLWMYGVFTRGYNATNRFKTIEELYATFKMLVIGYCSL